MYIYIHIYIYMYTIYLQYSTYYYILCHIIFTYIYIHVLHALCTITIYGRYGVYILYFGIFVLVLASVKVVANYQDQLFGIVCRALALTDTLKDPDDICRAIQHVLEKDALKGFIGHKTKVVATRALVIGNWRPILGDHKTSGLKVELSGGLLVDKTAAHSYTFMQRCGALLAFSAYCGWGQSFNVWGQSARWFRSCS